jgi:hypothetical protein
MRCINERQRSPWLEQRFVSISDLFDFEVRCPALQDGGRSGVVQHLSHRLCQGLGIANRHQGAETTVVENLARAMRRIRGDHGHTRSHRLDQHIAKALARGGKDEQIGCGVAGRGIVDVASKQHIGPYTGFLGIGAQLGSQRRKSSCTRRRERMFYFGSQNAR